MTVLSQIYGSYRQLMGHLPDPAFLCQGGQILATNAVALKALRVRAESDLIGQAFADLTGGDYRPVFEGGLAEVAGEGMIPMLLLRTDGTQMECEIRVTALEPGSDLYFVHARDLTERMRTIREVMASEQRYRALVDLALDAMIVVSNGRISMVNASAVQVLCLPSAESLVGQPLERIIHPDYHALLELGLDALSEERGLLPLKLITADGAGLDAEARVVALPGTRTHVLEARDISARVRAAEGVREREARLKGILNTVADAIVTIDEAGLVQSFNMAAERMFGMRADEAIGAPISRLLPEPDDNVVLPIPGVELEHSARRADGSLFPAAVTFSALRLGRQSLQTGVIRDITDRRRAEEAERRYTEDLERQVEERTRELLRLTQESRSVLNAAGDGILGINPDGIITFANPAMTDLLGWSPGDVIGRSAVEVFRHGDGARAGQPVRVKAALRRGVFHDRVEMTLMRRNGSTFIAEYTSSPIPSVQGEEVGGAVVVVRDITERRMVEERLNIAATVFETTAEGILVCGPDGIITVANPALARIVGGTAELGNTVDRILFTASDCSWDAVLETLVRTGHAEEEFWAERPVCRPSGRLGYPFSGRGYPPRGAGGQRYHPAQAG
ncbi:PAS domain S-box protein [Novispirillum itersonii]|uniref:PAS domain S-box protein n=1 Tax=Novispirillum itersonii TaxID=189 RepID=UPI0006874055|nr:PAS domain S-box protein [Novispirillum itersonii]